MRPPGSSIGRLAVTLSLCIACGAPARPPETRSPTEVAPRSDVLPELPEGDCAGFAELSAADPAELLGGRLRIARFTGLEVSARPHDVMSAPVDADVETRLFAARSDDTRFVVLTSELFATAGDDLRGEVAALLEPEHSVHRLDGPELPAVIAIPRELDLGREAVSLLQLYTATPDGLVQRTSFYATPAAAATGGCQRVALRLARTIEPGDRALRSGSGTRALFPGLLGVELPEGYHLTREGLHDFSVYRIHPPVRLSSMPAYLGIYVGDHPSRPETEGTTEVSGTLFGQPVSWIEREGEEGRRRELVVRHPRAPVSLHVFLGARDATTYAALVAIAESLTDIATPRALPECSTPTAAEPPEPAPEDPELAVLSSASSFTRLTATWARPTVPEPAAFRALVGRPGAARAFRHLALTAQTVEGRLYGLAGLQLVDPSGLEHVLCAVRGSLPARATALTACGEEELEVAALLESPAADAVRGESHWGELEWGEALAHGTADIRGGGLPRLLLSADPAGRVLADHAALLAGTGFIPPLDPSAPPAPRLTSGARGVIAPPMVGGHTGGGCAVRGDGRIACWGGARPARREGSPDAVLLPDVIRYPRAIAGRFGAGCMLDAEGKRVCWGDIEHAARRRASDCGAPPAPAAPLVMRAHDDGPWSRLVHAADLCGIRADGSLHCFPRGLESVPAWARLDPDDLRYHVPIEGRVEGLTSRYNDGVAWTADGRVIEIGRSALTEIGRFEGIRSVAVGIGGAVFVQLVDGRVVARGLHDEREWWRSSGPRADEWREIEALRGATLALESYHGCARFEDGRVACFGSSEGFVAGDEQYARQRPLTDVDALRGASVVWVDQRRACGWMRGDRIRCVGVEAQAGAGAPARDGVAQLDVGRLLRRAVEIPAPPADAARAQ